jgi:ubiquinone/menaquinone biosynthesis C-methylase UbiE
MTAMATASAETNLQIYDAAPVASHYASLNYLTPCERLLFDSYINPGGTILDLGVGGGRTTAWLACRASKYIGVDNAPAMVEACKAKFPGLQFAVGDAADLSDYADESFETVVFAFNGIDYVLPGAARRACLQQIHRVLKPNGIVVFSSHNPRAILICQGWNRERLREAASRFSAGSEFTYQLWLVALTIARSIWALFQSAAATMLRLPRRILSRAFWQGEGYIVDPAHGGLLTHCWIPRCVIGELNSAGFRVERVLGDNHPRPDRSYSTDWYYYVFTKSDVRTTQPCA